MTITGTTRIYFMLADPIAHVRTPEVLNPLLAERGLDAVVVPLQVAPAHLRLAWGAFRGMRNLGGLVVSVPHKAAIVELADEVGPAAARIGTANTVRREADGRLVVDNFDGQGFVAGLRQAGHDPAGRRILLVGCGGAGAAIAHSLAEAGAGALSLSDLDPTRAESVARRVAEHHPTCAIQVGEADPRGHDMAINATSSGLHPDDPLPLDPARLSPGTLAVDVIMKPEVTPFLAAAEARGCRVHHGRHMLDAQMALIRAFLGVA